MTSNIFQAVLEKSSYATNYIFGNISSGVECLIHFNESVHPQRSSLSYAVFQFHFILVNGFVLNSPLSACLSYIVSVGKSVYSSQLIHPK